MPEIDILSAKSNVESQLAGISNLHGTGISGNSLVAYVSSEQAANEVLGRVGNSPHGYNLQIVHTSPIKFL